MTTKIAEPTMLDGIRIEDILAPQPETFVFEGQKIQIFPMEDRHFMHIAEDMEKIVVALRESMVERGGSLFDEETIIAAVPLIAKGALPAVTNVIAASLRLDPEFVATVPMRKKVILLGLVFKAEHAEEIAKNVQGLLGMFATMEQPEITPITQVETSLTTTD